MKRRKPCGVVSAHETEVSRRAEREITGIRDYIARDNPRAADRVIARIRSAAQLLAAEPMIGRAIPDSGIRQWPVRGVPYILTYHADSELGVLTVLSVMYGARRRGEG